MTDRVGQQLGNYRLLSLLGKGGFAEVYLGEHIYLKTQAAIKVMRVQLTEQDVEDFLTEARTVAHLSHSHIVRVLECGVEQDIPFLVMTYAPNGTLRQRHPKGTQVPLATIVPYVRQIADALQYAHSRKIIHRDVKPENMLLGEEDEVLLSDFGTATIAQNTVTHSPQTMAGTIYYTAPEQLKGKATYASDQYGLAMVVFEWLSGRRPFRGSFAEVMSQHVLAPVPSLQDFVPDMSPAVDEVIQTALRKEPSERFSSILAFANAFVQASESDSIAARPKGSSTDKLPDERSEDDTFLLTPSRKPVITPKFAEDGLPDLTTMTPATTHLSSAQAIVEDIPTVAIPVGAGNQTPALLPAQQGDMPMPASSVSATAVTTTPSTGPNSYSSAPVAPVPASKRKLSRRAMIFGAAGVVVAGAGGMTWLELARKLGISSSGMSKQRGPTPTPDASQRATLYTYTGHTGPVNGLAWSPDSTRVASGSGDRTVQVWDALTGAHSFTYHGHSSPVRCLCWLYPGARIASGSKDTTVQVWDADNGGNVLAYHDHSSAINSVAGSPDGSLIASASFNVAHIWRAVNGDRVTLYKGHSDGINAIAWSPDASRIATGNQDLQVKIWSATSGSTIYLTYQRHSAPVKTLAWMPRGSLIASGDAGGQVRVWDTNTGHDVFVYQGHSDHVSSLAWSPDGTLIASASADRSVQIWNAKTGQRLFTYTGHQSPINAVAWSPDSQYLASGGEDKIVHIWKNPR